MVIQSKKISLRLTSIFHANKANLVTQRMPQHVLTSLLHSYRWDAFSMFLLVSRSTTVPDLDPDGYLVASATLPCAKQTDTEVAVSIWTPATSCVWVLERHCIIHAVSAVSQPIINTIVPLATIPVLHTMCQPGHFWDRTMFSVSGKGRLVFRLLYAMILTPQNRPEMNMKKLFASVNRSKQLYSSIYYTSL